MSQPSEIFFKVDTTQNDYLAFQKPSSSPSIQFPSIEQEERKQILLVPETLQPMTQLYISLLTVVGLYMVFRFTKL